MADHRNKLFVTGWPIKHSRSPLIHNHWLAIHGIEGCYEKVAVEPEKFHSFMSSIKESDYLGGNVTIPHKEMAFELCDRCDEAAYRIKAVNTLWTEDGQLVGGNTDGYGFLANLDQGAAGWDSSEARSRPAIVLGAGGASRAIIDALKVRGFDHIVIANRTQSRAKKLAEEFGAGCEAIGLDEVKNHLSRCDLLVNTTSLGMESGDELPADVAILPDDAIVTDIVYTPLITPLLKAARERGLRTVDGLGMLLHQAVPGFEKWYGLRPDVTAELRQILLRDLGEAPSSDTPLFVGLTGSIGMGKSTTAQMFRELGIPVSDSDAIVHRLYAGRAAPLIEEAFPGTVKAGVVDRGELSKSVIGDEAAMKRLEAIVHPLVQEEEEAFRARVQREKAPFAIFDAPLLFERNNTAKMDRVIVVTAPANIQKERVLSRPGMTEEKFAALLARQVPDAQKREQADFIVDTSLGMEDARRAVSNIVKTLTDLSIGR